MTAIEIVAAETEQAAYADYTYVNNAGRTIWVYGTDHYDAAEIVEIQAAADAAE